MNREAWNYIPALTADAPDWARREFERVSQAGFGVAPLIQFQVLHAEPPKRREGMEVYADGTDWNPGSGKGKYFFDGAAWVPMF